MVLFNYAVREITAKIVYYGPGLCGKTTNLQIIHEKLDTSARGKLLSLATDGDRTLFFDFLPIEMGSIGGYRVRFQLYTVPGQVHYNATRKLVLKGVDAVVFVADSQITMLERNKESFDNLVQNLAENGYEISKIPVVIQLNKRDLPNIASAADLISSMGVQGYPVLEAVASKGSGVFETLKEIVRRAIARFKTQFEAEGIPPAGQKEPPSPAITPPLPPPRPPSLPSPPQVSPAPPASQATQEMVRTAMDATGGGGAQAEEAVIEPTDEIALGGADAEEILLDDEHGASFSESVLEPPRETLPEEEIASPGTGEEQGLLDLDERRRAYFEEVALGEEHLEAATPAKTESASEQSVEEPPVDHQPAWADEIREEVRRLRRENRALREAFQRFAGTIDRQIVALREGRAELAGVLEPDDAAGEERRGDPNR